MADSLTTAGPGLNRRRSTRSVGEAAIKILLALAAVVSVVTTTGIVIALMRDTITSVSYTHLTLPTTPYV